MRKLTTITTLIIALVAIGITQTSLAAEPQINALAAGTMMAENPIVGYETWWTYENNDEEHEFRGLRGVDGWITILTIDGEDVSELGEKIPGIPYPEEGLMRNAGVNLWGFDEKGNDVGHGYVWYEILYPDTSIVIDFQIRSVRRVLNLKRGEVGDIILIDGVQRGNYSTYYGGFSFYINPETSFGDHTYEIVSSNGDRVAFGPLDFDFYPIAGEEPEQIFLNVRLPAGIREVGSGKTVEGIFELNELVSDGDWTETGRVFTADFSESQGYLHVSTHVGEKGGGGFDAVLIYVMNNGERLLVETLVPKAGEHYVYWNFPQMDQKVIVAILGDKGDKVYLYFQAEGGGKG